MPSWATREGRLLSKPTLLFSYLAITVGMETFPPVVLVPSPIFQPADLVPVTPIMVTGRLCPSRREAARPYYRCCNCHYQKQQDCKPHRRACRRYEFHRSP